MQTLGSCCNLLGLIEHWHPQKSWVTQHDTKQHNTTQHNTTQHNTTRAQHDTTRHNTTRHNTTQHNTTQHNTTQHNTTQHNTTQHNTTQHNTTQHNTTQHNTTQHNTTQHNTTQHNTTQHNTAQHNCLGPRSFVEGPIPCPFAAICHVGSGSRFLGLVGRQFGVPDGAFCRQVCLPTGVCGQCRPNFMPRGFGLRLQQRRPDPLGAACCCACALGS